MHGFKYKGEVEVFLHDNKGNIKYQTKQTNLFLDNGRRKAVSQLSSNHVILSASSDIEFVEAQEVPQILEMSTVGTKTFPSTYQVRIYKQFAPPAANRTIGIIGLTLGSGNTTFCYTRLTTPILQTTLDYLDIYYTYTVEDY